MKKTYYFLAALIIFLAAHGCRKDHVNALNDDDIQKLSLKAAFDKLNAKSDVKPEDKIFNENLKTKVLWDNITFKSPDTAIIGVETLDDVKIFTNDSIPIDLNDNLIIKATKNQNGDWQFVKVMFLPEYGDNLPDGFTGRIISEGYFDNNYTVTKYYGGRAYFTTFNSDNTWFDKTQKPKLKAGGLPGDPRCQPEEDDRIVEGYVEGELNVVVRFPKTKLPHAACSDDPILGGGGSGGGGPAGSPSDLGGGGGGGGNGGGSPPLKKFSKNDPCANKNELNNRKKNSKISGKINEIKNLTSQNGKEHGSNAYINLNNGNITRFTDVEVGYSTGSGQEVESYQGWKFLSNNEVEVTTDYNHTHPFESGPSALDVFDGIYPFMATNDGNIIALTPAQKQMYLSYLSINVMTTNHDYAITITDPAKWVSRYANAAADQNKFKDISSRYEDMGHETHSAQELALLDLYGDMIQLYRSDKGTDKFEPLSSKVDPATFKKFISNINCN